MTARARHAVSVDSLPSPYVELDRARLGPAARQPPAQPRPPRTSPGCAAWASGSTCTRSRRSTCRCPGCSTSTSAPPTGLHRVTSDFLGERPSAAPFVIGVAGSVAVGKSTTARILRELLARWPGTPRVELVTTDGFLYPNAELERRGLLQRKGFPESYDRRALLRFVAEVKSGAAEVSAPVYSHLTYDIVPGRARRWCAGPTC